MPTAWHSDSAYPGERRSLKHVALTGSDDGGSTLAEVLCKEHPFQATSISWLVDPTLRRRVFCFWQSAGTVLVGVLYCRGCRTPSSRHGQCPLGCSKVWLPIRNLHKPGPIREERGALESLHLPNDLWLMVARGGTHKATSFPKDVDCCQGREFFLPW